MFDELDAVENETVYEPTRPRHLHTKTPDAVVGETPDAVVGETPDTVMGETPNAVMRETPSRCQFKNTLQNGIVVGALENRYDHFVREGEESEG